MKPPPGALAGEDPCTVSSSLTPEMATRGREGWAMGPGAQQGRITPSLPAITVLASPQLINLGPSSISRGVLELSCPQALEGRQLLYVTRVTGLSNCTTSHPLNPQGLEVRGLETCLGVRGPRLRGLVGKVALGLEEPIRMCLELGLGPLERVQKALGYLKALGGKKTYALHPCLSARSILPLLLALAHS